MTKCEGYLSVTDGVLYIDIDSNPLATKLLKARVAQRVAEHLGCRRFSLRVCGKEFTGGPGVQE